MPTSDFPWPVVASSIGVIGTLLGAFVGSWLTSRQDKQSKDTKSRSIRQMLRTEMQHNLDQLSQWSAGTPLPVQSHQIWQSLLESVPTAMTPEQIKEVHLFYYNLYGTKKLADSKSSVLDSSIRQLLHTGNPLGSAD